MSDVVTLYDEADRLKAEGQLDAAAAKLEEALSVDDNYALAHSALAVVFFFIVKPVQAINERRAAGQAPEDSPAPSDEALLLAEIRDLLQQRTG